MIRLRFSWILIGLLPLVSNASPIDEPDSPSRAFTSALSGDWKGTLEYRDYSRDNRVKLPTTLEARAEGDGRSALLKFRYDEGKNRFVESKDLVRIDEKAGTLRWESEGGSTTEYRITGLESFSGKKEGTLTLTGPTIENGEKAEARETLTLQGDTLTLRKETRKPGADFAFRNEYRLVRAGNSR